MGDNSRYDKYGERNTLSSVLLQLEDLTVDGCELEENLVERWKGLRDETRVKCSEEHLPWKYL